MHIAKKDDWQTKPFPEQSKTIAFIRYYSLTEFQLITAGLIPLSMEDKWFIYYDYIYDLKT